MLKPLSLILCGLSLTACGASTYPDSVKIAPLPTQTCIQTTNNALDWAIDGTGYFNVIDPASGKRMFTRKGNFKLTDKGEIATAEGYLLDPAVTIQPGTTNYLIEKDGTVKAAQPGQTETSVVARVTISRFNKPEQLKAEATGYFTQTSESGSAENGQPSVNGFGSIQAKAIESTTCK